MASISGRPATSTRPGVDYSLPTFPSRGGPSNSGSTSESNNFAQISSSFERSSSALRLSVWSFSTLKCCGISAATI
jgi:hypothetical protein